MSLWEYVVITGLNLVSFVVGAAIGFATSNNKK